MTAVKVMMPEEMTSYIENADDRTRLMQNALMLYPYIKNQTISHGRAAEILGMKKFDFIELYGELGIPYIDYDASEVEEDLQTLREIFQAAK